MDEIAKVPHNFIGKRPRPQNLKHRPNRCELWTFGNSSSVAIFIYRVHLISILICCWLLLRLFLRHNKYICVWFRWVCYISWKPINKWNSSNEQREIIGKLIELLFPFRCCFFFSSKRSRAAIKNPNDIYLEIFYGPICALCAMRVRCACILWNWIIHKIIDL